MTDFRYYFHKFGGFNLVKQYFRAGVLGTAVMQFLSLGKSKTALEILRLSVSLKVKQRLAKKYKSVLDEFDNNWNPNLSHESNRTIWIFWWQGMENAPDLVKFCYESVKKNLGSDWEIVLLTEHNYKEYVAFPTHIVEKFQSGTITLTHLSDLLRLELLIKYGGLWLDATVFCSSGNIPKSIIESDFFCFMAQKPGSNGRAIPISSWFMYATTNNKLLVATRKLIYEYWKKKDYMVDYFLLHHFLSIVLDHYPDTSKSIPPFCNSVPHILLLHLFCKYDEKYWQDLKQMTCFHKLSYKLEKEKCSETGTYYDAIINSHI